MLEVKVNVDSECSRMMTMSSDECFLGSMNPIILIPFVIDDNPMPSTMMISRAS